MEFKTEVQQYFKNAGWYEGRNVKDKFDSVSRFNEFPDFLKQFLYEYGDLIVETHKYNDSDVTATLNLQALTTGLLTTEGMEEKKYFGVDLLTFPFAYYPLDNTVMECDINGKIYMDGDFPSLISNDFKTGIENVIMEDYSDTLEWDPEKKEWVEEY